MNDNVWLQRLKNLEALATDPTEPTKGCSVGFVASRSGDIADQASHGEGPERWTWPNSTAMTGAEIEAFTARLAVFVARLPHSVAEKIAHVLLDRDRDLDDRRLCLECSNLGVHGMCHAAAAGRLPGAASNLHPVVTVLARCPAFGLKKGLA